MLSVHIHVFLPQSSLASLGAFPELQLLHSVIEELRYLPFAHSTETISTVKLFFLLYKLQKNKQILSILLYYICKNNPKQVSCPIRKIRSEELEYQNACNEYFKHLSDRGHSESAVNEASNKFDEVDRYLLYQSQSNKLNGKRKKCFPLISEFNLHLPAIPQYSISTSTSWSWTLW